MDADWAGTQCHLRAERPGEKDARTDEEETTAQGAKAAPPSPVPRGTSNPNPTVALALAAATGW